MTAILLSVAVLSTKEKRVLEGVSLAITCFTGNHVLQPRGDTNPFWVELTGQDWSCGFTQYKQPGSVSLPWVQETKLGNLC